MSSGANQTRSAKLNDKYDDDPKGGPAGFDFGRDAFSD
jgi:hypothetical protein